MRLYMLDWYAYGIGKVPTKVATTYQNISDAWSLLIDQKWHDRITAIKAMTADSAMWNF